jgi:nucleoside-diphosphate-sugar epimerase
VKKVLIVGATGFIGSNLLESFYRSGIYHVSVLVRNPGKLSEEMRDKVQVIHGELSDAATACKGQDLVVHNAALTKDWGSWSLYKEATIDGTKSVIQACRDAAVPRIIMTGTNSVYGEEDCPEPKDENWPYNPERPYFMGKLIPSSMNYYRISKAEASAWARSYAREHGLNLTILEPAWVYGPGELGGLFSEYLDTIASGLPVMPGSMKNIFPVVYVKDLCQAYLNAAEADLPGVQSILLSNPEKILMGEFFSRLVSKAGLKAPSLLPKWLSMAAGCVLEFLWLLFRAKNPPVLTRARVAMFYDNVDLNPDRARELLGMNQWTSYDDSIAETVSWLHDQGILDNNLR